MMAKQSRVNLRVSEELMALLEEIRERKGIGSISELVRDALEKYADEEDSWNSDLVKVRIPYGLMNDLEKLIMAGDATDASQALNFALLEWTASRKRYHLEGKEAFAEKIDEVIQERAVKEKLKSAAARMKER